MTANRREFAIGILNFNTRDHLVENLDGCLRSGVPSDSLLVLDNCSSDGSIQAVNQRHPQVRTLRSDRNVGYAGGMNKIVEALDANWVVLVTADCYITLETINGFLMAMESVANVAVAGCRIIDRRTGRIQSEGGDITYPLGIPLSRSWQEASDPSDPGHLSEVTYIDGAVMAVDRSKFQELGGFDESYFAYQEDVDLCWRARMRGYRVLCTGSAWASHVTSASFGQYTALRWLLSERNRIANNIKNLESPHLVLALLYELLYFGAITVGAVAFRTPGYQRAYYRGLASLLRGLKNVLAERRTVQHARTRRDRDVLAHHPKMGLIQLAKALSKRAALVRQLGT